MFKVLNHWLFALYISVLLAIIVCVWQINVFINMAYAELFLTPFWKGSTRELTVSVDRQRPGDDQLYAYTTILANLK